MLDHFNKSKRRSLFKNLALAIMTAFMGFSLSMNALAGDWQKEFNIANRQLSDTGESDYFILKPGFQAVLESRKAKLTITVLDEIKEINGITTRIVEEREENNSRLFEISRNFFAIDLETGDVFYFGEEVDNYNKKGKIKNHSGSWMANEKENNPGLIMPGKPAVGMKYYQELAPGVAMDRGQVISTSETFLTPAGEFENCLVTKESSKIKRFLIFSPKERKTYAPGIGLIQDENLKLTRYGYLEKTDYK